MLPRIFFYAGMVKQRAGQCPAPTFKIQLRGNYFQRNHAAVASRCIAAAA